MSAVARDLGFAAAVVAAVLAGSCDQSTGQVTAIPDLGPQPVPGADALPVGAISYFSSMSCPAGWVPFGDAEGRFVVPSVGGVLPGSTWGDPLGDAEDRTHGHTLTANIQTDSFSLAGIAGTGNDGVAGSGSVKIDLTVTPASSALPYIQLLVCRKVAAPELARDHFPSGMTAFFALSGCPEGWRRTASTQGRMPVALPTQGRPAAVFGGPPLAPIPRAGDVDAGGTVDGGVGADSGTAEFGDGGVGVASPPPRHHTHLAGSVVQTQPYGLAILTGCCASGFAKNNIYSFTTNTGPNEVGAPYIELLQCETP